jgi:alkylation response protein AidB-like acyl-CoA dehydrogenase
VTENNTDTANLVAQAVDDYLRRAYDGDRRQLLLETGGWNSEFCAELASLGWYALAVPDSHGGLAAPLSALGPIFVHIGRYLVVGPQIENALLPAILQRSSQRNLDPALNAAVETGVPVALVDPGITYDWIDEVGSVRVTPDGLCGTVNAVRFAGQANRLAVVAETVEGPQLYLVDASGAGVRIEPLSSNDATTMFARVAFENAQPLDNNAGYANDIVNEIRSWTRILIACELSGIAQRCLDRTLGYVCQREQFGRVIGGFQAVKHIAADMYTQTSTLHNLCLATLRDTDCANGRQLDLLATTLKSYASSTAVRVCEAAIQLHGGIGFTTETELNFYYKHALSLRAWYGDESELEPHIGAAVLHGHREGTTPADASCGRGLK